MSTSSANLSSPVTWHGEPGHVIDTGDLRLVVLERGGKVASLVDAKSRAEWLAQPKGGTLVESGYGADFIASEMCGWDECAPTVDATTYRGADIPDHGEVWGVDWSTRSQPEALVQEVSGHALPYTLRRTLIKSDDALRFTYEVVNDGDEALPFVWTGHPQFLATTKSTVALTGDVAEATVPGGRGAPLLRRAGRAGALDAVRRGESHKTWLRLGPGRAEVVLAHADRPGRLRFAWDTRAIPYVAFWQDNALYSREPVVACELSNGWYDNLAVAERRGRCLVVPAGDRATWSFDLSVA
jgi:galactose mutarotase-like enzyme